jgi:hypothetical protein
VAMAPTGGELRSARCLDAGAAERRSGPTLDPYGVARYATERASAATSGLGGNSGRCSCDPRERRHALKCSPHPRSNDVSGMCRGAPFAHRRIGSRPAACFISNRNKLEGTSEIKTSINCNVCRRGGRTRWMHRLELVIGGCGRIELCGQERRWWSGRRKRWGQWR